MPKPAKSASKCKLDLLPDVTQGRTDVKTISIFEQKRVRGFWPCYNEESGERQLTVRNPSVVIDFSVLQVIVLW